MVVRYSVVLSSWCLILVSLFADFTDTAEYWSFPFESPGLTVDLESAWEEIKPLYEQLLTYVRRRLREYYGPER